MVSYGYWLTNFTFGGAHWLPMAHTHIGTGLGRCASQTSNSCESKLGALVAPLGHAWQSHVAPASAVDQPR